MKRHESSKFFKCSGPAVLPVIHALDSSQCARNIRIAIQEGAPGVLLINHNFGVDDFLPIVREIRKQFPALWFGVNFLGVTGAEAFPILAQLQNEGCTIDAYWGDDARINELEDDQTEAKAISETRLKCGWNGLYFGGVAFKKQRPVDPGDYERSASIAANYMDIVTTSGKVTGDAAPLDKIMDFRKGVKSNALAVASGISPDNVSRYRNHVDVILVATGINKPNDFYNIEPLQLRRLLAAARSNDDRHEDNQSNAWYMSLMAPRSRSEKYAWIDPSSAYINARSFDAILDDLSAPFEPDEIDVVAGIDAAGFILSAALAVRMNKGVLTLRKGGKTPVGYDVVPMLNYSAQTQELEMRKPAFAPGTRVLLVDQWIETGGTMDAAIRLVERQQGVVAGIAVVCVEENPATQAMRSNYKMSSCVILGSDLQTQCNEQTLKSFETFKPEWYFPDTGDKI